MRSWNHLLILYKSLKLACPNLDYCNVLEFIRERRYNSCGFFLKDLDVTLDYAGSFNKEELVDHLVKCEGFRVQGDLDQVGTRTRTIVDNDNFVGKNCLTFLETLDGITTRQKKLQQNDPKFGE